MSSVRMSVAEAAEMLDVHPQRVHQRIREGSLPAEKVGNQWVIEVSDLRRLQGHGSPGRRLSSKSAWDLLIVAANEQAASELSPSARSRAKSRLRGLVAQVSSAEPHEAAAHLVRALGKRAQRMPFVASPRDLPDVRDDERFHSSGLSLPESNMSAPAFAEGYVYSDDLDGLSEDYLLSPAPRSRANVILHVVPSPPEGPAILGLDAIARSPLAIAADLAEHDGIREQNEATRSVMGLYPQFVAEGANVPGGKRG